MPSSSKCIVGIRPVILILPLFIDVEVRPPWQLGDRILVALHLKGQLANGSATGPDYGRQQREREPAPATECDEGLDQVSMGEARQRLGLHELEPCTRRERRSAIGVGQRRVCHAFSGILCQLVVYRGTHKGSVHSLARRFALRLASWRRAGGHAKRLLRPMAFMVQDKRTRGILFLGRVANPKEWKLFQDPT